MTKTSTAVTLSAPANTATVSSTPALSWQPKPFAARYAVEVYRNGDTSASPGNRAFNQLTDLTSITPSNNNQLNGGTALPQGTYAWRVRGVDGGGNGASWSAWRTFTVSPPGISLLQPANNSVFTTQSAVSFSWTPVDGAVKYHIYVSSNSTNPRTSANLGNLDTVMTSWSPSVQFPTSATIHWQVDALRRAEHHPEHVRDPRLHVRRLPADDRLAGRVGSGRQRAAVVAGLQGRGRGIDHLVHHRGDRHGHEWHDHPNRDSDCHDEPSGLWRRGR